MDNPETLATLGAQDEDKQNKKHNTAYIGGSSNTDYICMYFGIHFVNIDTLGID